MAHSRRQPQVSWLVIAFAVLLSSATALPQVAAPQRKAGWWEMSAHLPSGETFTRYLCLDANYDTRHSIFSAQDGCTMSAQKIEGGYSYKKVCQGQPDITGTAIGDFNSAYKITEQRGKDQIKTDALWLGAACPAGRKPGDMQLPGGQVINSD